MESTADYEDFSDYCTDHGYILIRQEIPGHGKAAVDGKLVIWDRPRKAGKRRCSLFI